MHSARFLSPYSEHFGIRYFDIDPFDWVLVFIFVALVVYFSSVYAIHYIFVKIAGGEYEECVNSDHLPVEPNFGSSSYIDNTPSYKMPVRPYKSLLDYPKISDDYYGMHGEFDLNDESRRISEDIQQFHRSHPDADLSDHYNWEDILDAETDGYLD